MIGVLGAARGSVRGSRSAAKPPSPVFPPTRSRALRAARRVAQVGLLLLSLLLIVHGWLGPERASKNLTTLLVWVHYRGLLVLALLVAGNLFCMACPMVLARDLVRRWVTPRRRWPRALSTKWPAVLLTVGVLFGYELFDWWSDPRATAALMLTIFAGAVGIDAVFQRASFCHYVCPIGQFSFAASTLSPLEVTVRDPATCTSCVGKECIRGSAQQRGCELDLFQPRKRGNLDCTFCLDCVAACPHQNVELAVRVPGRELWDGGFRSGIGRLAKRPDIGALMTVFVFGALLNALGMVSPVYALHELLAARGLASPAASLSAIFAVGLIVEPALLLGLASLATRRATRSRDSVLAIAMRYVHALVPLGFAVWLAHYAFHLLTGFWTFLPLLQRQLEKLGCNLLGPLRAGPAGLPVGPVQSLEMAILTLGLLGSLAVAWSIASSDRSDAAVRAFVPWAALCITLFAGACWLLSQPMEMRGVMPR